MTFLKKLPFKFLHKQHHNVSGIGSSNPTQAGIVPQQSGTLQPQPKSLSALEKQVEAQFIATYPHQPSQRVKAKWGLLSKLTWTAILLGIPVSVVWVANLPYPVIRRPVAQTAPFLLLPSYMNIDNEYRLAIASVEQAKQLVDNPTSPADLDLGEQKVKEAQAHLDALPLWFLNDWPEYRSWWYDWRFRSYEFQAAREKIGQLAAKVFQEKNAQTQLIEKEQTLNTAKQQYRQASTATDKQIAIASWKTALDGLEQIPSETLAGKTAQKKLDANQREFKEVVGLAAGNERISTLIQAARQFSAQAAIASQNPPHTVAQWQQVENLWQEAIVRLEQIPSEDLAGYAEAQKLLAINKANLGEIQIRRQAEADSVAVLEQAQRQGQDLLASTPTNAELVDRNRTISQLQGIIDQLEKVQSGTTAYLEAQALLLSAKHKLKQLQP